MVWFTNDERGLVLNKTNNRTLRGAFGDDCRRLGLARSSSCSRRWTIPRQAWCRRLRVRIPPAEAGRSRERPGPSNADAEAAAAEADAVAQLDDFADENEPPAKPAAKSSPTDDLDDEIPW